jgi:putative flavoprotein involved in K+ transport
MRPLILTHGRRSRVKMRDAIAAGVEREPRIVAVEDGLPACETVRPSGRHLVWLHRLYADYSWIQFPVAGPYGLPRHMAGIAEGGGWSVFRRPTVPDKVGVRAIGGMGEDAAFVASEIARRLGSANQPLAALRQVNVSA